jgi:type VI secretion system protein ImpE
MTPAELYQAGQLSEAIDAALQSVKSKPTDVTARFFLSELLCFAGEFERADRQLETIMQQTTEAAVRISLFRQLLRGEIARQQFFREGRLPEFLVEPTPALRLHLEASIALRENKPQEAADLLAAAEDQRPSIAGTFDGTPFDDCRDLDDLTAPLLEVLTSTGKYYWVPLENVESIEFSPPERAMDLVWRTAQVNVAGGPEGGVYVPVLYPGTGEAGDSQLQLGRGTDWRGGDGSPVRGIGQKMFLFGEEAKPLMQLRHLQFELASRESADDED